MYTNIEMIVFIFACGLGTFLTRVIPFIFLPDGKETPKIIIYLGRVLPAACMGLLIIYCLKDVTLLDYPYGLPEAIGIASVAILHKWKGNALLSIFGGTILYMVLVHILDNPYRCVPGGICDPVFSCRNLLFSLEACVIPVCADP